MKTLISKIFIGFLITAASFASGNARDLIKLKASECTEEEKEHFYNFFGSMPKVLQREEFIGYAEELPCIACMELVLNRGLVEINSKSLRENWPYTFNTALMVAVKNNQEEAVEFLLSKGADANIKDENQDAPISLAIIQNNCNMVRLLLDAGADVNIRNAYENTPLILAAIQNNSNIVNSLLNEGADIDAKNTFGLTAMGYAELSNSQSVLKLLKEAAKKKHSEL